jgi:hypothetical protein
MKSIRLAGIVLVACLFAPFAWCQQSPADQTTTGQSNNTPTAPDQPLPPNTSSSGSVNDAGAVPAGRSLLGAGPQDSGEGPSQPLSGAENVGLAAGAQAANFFDASALASGAGDSALLNSQGNLTWGANEVFGGGLTLNRAWSAGRFSLSYSGGAVLYQPSKFYPDSMFHSLSLTQEFEWKRLTLRLLDQFSYSPTSLYGGAGAGGPGLLSETGSGASTINPTYTSNNSILTGQTREFNNTAIGEIQYNLSRRSSVTATGSYGLLDYEGAGYISDHYYVAGAGFNYSFTPKDTLAVTYTFNQTQYSGTPQRTEIQQATMEYSHQISGRMVFEVGAGPEFYEFHGYTPPAGNELSWTANVGLQYQMRRTSLGATYSRGSNAGSGVFFGSSSQNVSGSVTHQFSRFLTGVVNAGYSFNSELVNVPGAASEYHNWYAGATLGRQFGAHARVSFNYGALQQPSNGVCPVASCGTNQLTQTVGVSLDLHIRPIGSPE